MGKGKRPRPARLGEKLAMIRDRLGLSQNEMLWHLGLNEELTREELSAYERGVREPPLYVLLRFSEIARVWVNVLIDDRVNLPDEILSRGMSEGVIRNSSRKRNR
jgi:transcriptional regulator with XRE-family HTH domain